MKTGTRIDAHSAALHAPLAPLEEESRTNRYLSAPAHET